MIAGDGGMRVWLATVGEPLPEEGANVRLLRTAQFAQWLSDNGHEVVFWTGTMDHAGRRLRHRRTTVTEVSPSYRIVQLAGRLYSKAVSLQRIGNHRDVAREFARQAMNFPPPDIILSSFPTEELCRQVLDYAEPKGIPVVIDVRDLWPDIFKDAIPAPARFLAPLALLPFDRAARDVFRRASAITGPAKSMIRWGLRKAGRDWRDGDFWFPFTYPAARSAADPSRLPDCFRTPDAGERAWFCFLGALSPRSNLEMVIDGFAELDRQGVKASVIICGGGDAAPDLKRRAGAAKNISFPGWIDIEQIQAIMSVCRGGIFPYNQPDFFNSLPNKISEYLSAGLPIIACTKGEVQNLIAETGCGFWHEPKSTELARQIRAVLDNPDAMNLAAQRARKTYATYFERENVFETTLSELARIAATGSQGKSRIGNLASGPDAEQSQHG